MASVLRYRVIPAIINASRSCSFLKAKSPNNVRSLATAVKKKEWNILKNSQDMSIHQCLLLVENKINTRGKLTQLELDCITRALQKKGSLHSNQVLLLIRCCGSIAVNEKPEIRMVYAQKIWNMIKASGFPLDITHHNAYLKVQMENEQRISPAEYLKNITEEGLVPNRVTYQYLVINCSVNGDLVGATQLLEEMKSQNYPLNENVFNALVMGHAMTNDIDGAEGIINIMNEKEIYVTSKTYSMYLCGLAVAGNIDKMRSVMEECSKQKLEITGSRMMDVVYYLFMNGHYDYGEELLKSLEGIYKFSEMFTLQFRLLHKKNYEGYLRTLPFISNSDDLTDKIRLAFRYLGNKEDFESIMKFKELCDEKALNVDPLKNILFYSLLNFNSEKCLKIMDHLHESGHTMKETYFAPLIINAAKKGDVTELLHILSTATYRYSYEVKLDFLARHVFNHLDFQDTKMTVLIRGLSAYTSSVLVYSALIRSAVKDFDPKKIAFILNKAELPGRIAFTVIESMARSIKNEQNLFCVTNIMAKWLRQRRALETDMSQSNNFQETFDTLAIKISQHCTSNITENFLKVAEGENFPISAAVVDSIRQKLNNVPAESPGAGTTENGFKSDNGEIPKPEVTFDAENHVISNFSKFRKDGNITEMEKYFNENESLQNDFGFRKIVETLKILNEEDLVKQYLKRYYEKYSQVQALPRNLYLETEMINRGMFKEGIELLSKRFSFKTYTSSVILTNIFTPVLERANENEIKELFCVYGLDKKLIRLRDIMDSLVQRGAEAAAVKIVLCLDEEDFRMADISKSLIPALHNKKKFEMMQELIKYIEDKPTLKKSSPELILLYACTGNIEKGRGIFDGHAPLKWIENLSAINLPDRLQVLENTIAIIRGNEYYGIGKVYESLMNCYKMESVSPDKALDLWLNLQEENVPPTNKFLHTLAEILKKSGRKVPFQLPKQSNTDIEITLPSSFPVTVKRAILSLRSGGLNRVRGINVTALLLKNELNESHIATIFSFNKNLDTGFQKTLQSLQSLIEWKKAFEKGALLDQLEKFIANADGKTPEVRIKSLPFRLLLGLLDLIPVDSIVPRKDVMLVILWSHWQNSPEYKRFANMLEPTARAFLKSEQFLNRLVKGLEMNSLGQTHKRITSFLLAQGVFNDSIHLKMRAEALLNSNAPVSQYQSLAAQDSSSDDIFSFRGVFHDQTEEQGIQSDTESEEPVKEVESPDVIQKEKRESEAGSNI